MSASLVALFVALGSATWIFTKLNQKTGYGNSGSAIKGAAVSGLIIFLIVFTIAKMALHNS